MNILLIRPKSRVDSIIPPLGLGYLAKQVYLNHKVKIIDCLKDGISEKKLLNYIDEYQPDLVGFTAFHTDKEVVLKYLIEIKKYKKDITTVIGGPYSSCEEPKNIFSFFGSYLDFAFAGEAELGFKNFVEKLKNYNFDYFDIDGLIWLDKNRNVIKNKVRFVENLDLINPPLWEEIKPNTYPLAPQGGFLKKYPFTSINISRGCPHRCSFCAGHIISGYKVRYRSIENVIDEIKLLYYEYGIREFHILDDNFTFNKSYVEEFCRNIIKLNLNISFACPNGVRIDTLDEEVLKLMKKTGFYILHLGIESGSSKILTYMHKDLTTKEVLEKTKLMKKLNFELCGYFIFGYPKERFFDRIKTIFFSLKLPLTKVMFMNFMPIPSTEAYKQFEFEKINLYKKTFYSTFFGSFFSRVMLKFSLIFGLFVFYIRPKILIRNILCIYNFKHFLHTIKRITRISIVGWQ
jgi:radical SAM superfamily enzyme YgiQ (UPF0313 family)